ncbi:MAG: sulfatase [Desulfobacteraceae bacterium]
MTAKLPNIILIVMDTASAKHMSLYGYHRPTTPQLERLADRATVYSRCFAPGNWTLPSHASLFTGLYPSEHGIDRQKRILDANFQHLVSVLKHLGYHTYGISCNGIVSPDFGNCRDFDVFHDYSGIGWSLARLRNSNDNALEILNKLSSKSYSSATKLFLCLEYAWRQKDMGILKAIIEKTLSVTLKRNSVNQSAPYTRRSFHTALKDIRQHLRRAPGTPFFLFMNVIENHEKYNPPEALRKFSGPQDQQPFFNYNFYRDDYNGLREQVLPLCCNLYDDTMLFLDGMIGQFFDQLQAQGLTDNTLFIVTSDHGEHFGEKDFYVHNLSLHNELTWVPLLISFPAGLHAPGTDDRLVSLVDFFATFLDLCQSPFPCPRHSCSLLSAEKRSSLSAMVLDNMLIKIALAGKIDRSSEWAQARESHRYALILDNGLKLLEHDDGRLEIYNLNQDPNENQDLSPTLPLELIQDLQALLVEDQQQKGYQSRSIAELDSSLYMSADFGAI